MKKALALLCIVWGLNWVVMKQANQFFPPVLFVTYRFMIGAAVLLTVACWRKTPLPDRQYWPWIILTGVLQTAFNNVVVQIGMQYLGAGFSAVLTYSMPLWVAVMAYFLLGEALTSQKVAGIGLSMVGLVTLLNVSGGGNWWAVLLTLSGAVAWALSSVLIKLKLQGCDMLQFTTWQMAAGAVSLALYAALFAHGGVQWSWPAIGCLLYNGVLASALAFFLWSYILSHAEAGVASISVLAVPAVGVLAGAVLLKEPVYWNTAAGMALILSGVLLVNRNGQKVAAASQEPVPHKTC